MCYYLYDTTLRTTHFSITPTQNQRKGRGFFQYVNRGEGDSYERDRNRGGGQGTRDKGQACLPVRQGTRKTV
jgi:hypothetical protein